MNNWFDFWKKEAENKDFCELMRNKEVNQNTKFLFAEEYGFACGLYSMGVWLWGDSNEELLSGLLEVNVRKKICFLFDEDFDDVFKFDLPVKEFAQSLVNNPKYSRYKDALLQIVEFSNKIDYELAKGKVSDSCVRVFCSAWLEISENMNMPEKVKFYTSLKSALNLVKMHGVVDIKDCDSYKEVFVQDFVG